MRARDCCALLALTFVACANVLGADFDGLHRRCASGLVDCDDNASTGASGCEVDTAHESLNCGQCGAHCAGSCNSGVCSAACTGTLADCDHDTTTGARGCETDLDQDSAHCGQCDIDCTHADGGALICLHGQCVAACDGGYGDCNNNPSDGCETSLQSDPLNCGACGVACENAHGSTTCVAGKCQPMCDTGFQDCDTNLNNGCEAEFARDARNCGGCGVVCLTGGVCQNGACSCPSSRPDVCGSACVDLQSDPKHCGGCDAPCGSPTNTAVSCEAGTCAFKCAASAVACAGGAEAGCSDLSSDASNCGACAKKCGGTLACLSGNCCEPPAAGGTCQLAPACGCDAGSVCVPDTPATGLTCQPTKNLGLGAACDTGDCKQGFGCFGGACKPYCAAATDCPLVDGAQDCEQGLWKDSGSEITGVKFCSVVCDLAHPQSPVVGLSACGVGLGCVQAGNNASDCAPAGSSGPGEPCSDSALCAPGGFCSSGICYQYCLSSDDCSTGTCNPFTTPVQVGSHTFGACY